MKNEETASISIMKIIFVSMILVLLSGIGVVVMSASLNEVKIVFPNGYEISTVTSKTKVSEILESKNVVLAENEKSIPDLDEEISSGDEIKIVEKTEQELLISNISENTLETTDDLLNNYNNITEEIVKEQIEIPFETITKEEGEGTEAKNEVLQEGENGIKEYRYKIKYKNGVNIEKTLISEEIIKQPVNKIVQIKKVQVTTRSAILERGAVSGTVAEYQEYAEQKCKEYGWSDSDFTCLVLLWNRESNWNVTAENRSSGAYGIPQALPASKMASFGSDYLTNYKTQIDWGLNYIKRRYITPTEAWAHSQRLGWY